MLTRIINALIQVLAMIASAVLSLLPDSPFQWSVVNVIKSMPYISVVFYFVPFEAMISVTMAYITAVTGYYVLRWILRLVKMVGD